jgi:hypothetical protein
MGVNQVSFTKRGRTARTAGGVILATSLLAFGLVTAATGSSSAAPISAQIAATCRGANAKSNASLDLAAVITGTNTVAVSLKATAADIPESAAIGESVDSTFNWSATLAQSLIDAAATLKTDVTISNIKSQMLVKGPSSVPTFDSSAPQITLTPVAGTASELSLGSIGGPITTTGGGILTYRVASVSLTASLIAIGDEPTEIDLICTPDGSNLLAKTSVKDPDAPTFTPEIIPLATTAGGVATVDLLGGNPPIITEGKTPLLPESLKIVEFPAAGDATINDGVFSFTAPADAGTYSTTVEICGAPKTTSGEAGVSEVQNLQLGANWTPVGTGGGLPILGQAFNPRPVAFSLKVAEKETKLIWVSENVLAPALFPVPLGGRVPTPENWAPEGSAGLVNQYATETRYTGVSAAKVQSALEALPTIGAGNVIVTDLKNDPARESLITDLRVEFVGSLAESDVPDIKLGQWYSVPPQETLSRINTTLNGLLGSLGGDTTAPPAPPGPLDDLTGPEADKYIGDKILASIGGGPGVTPEEWSAWIDIRIVQPVTDAAPAILAFLNGLFPKLINSTTVTQGEAPASPQRLCSQGIIDVTVTAGVLGITLENSGAQVAGTSDTQGLGFVG